MRTVKSVDIVGGRVVVTYADGTTENLMPLSSGDGGITPEELAEINRRLDVLTSEVGTLATLEEGSTTGDAELINGRIGYDGEVYQNIGTAIREQINDLHETKMEYYILSFDGTSFKHDGTTLNFAQIREKCLDEKHFVYALYDNQMYIPQWVSASNVMFDSSYIRNDVPQMHRIGISSSNAINKYDFNLAKADDLSDAKQDIQQLSESNTEIFNASISTGTQSYIANQTLSNIHAKKINIRKGQKLRIKIITENAGDLYSLVVNCNNASKVLKTFYMAYYKEMEYIVDVVDDITEIGFYSASGNVKSTGAFTYEIEPIISVKNNYEDITHLKEKIRKALTFSILGDSWSTYYGFIPAENNTWYAVNGVDGVNYATNNVNDVSQTWWYKLSKETGMPFIKNESWAGATISTTGWSSSSADMEKAFATRCKKLGEQRVYDCKPNIIFIEGGLNDTWATQAKAKLGELQYSDWTDEDLKYSINAFCFLLHHLKKFNPQARIINIVPPAVRAELKTAMVTACEHYDVENLALTTVNTQEGHPSIQGMTDIYNAVMSIL